MKIPTSELRQKLLGTLVPRFGETASERIAEVLLYADMSGRSTQGVIKLTGTAPLQNVKPVGDIRIERETPVSALIDGCANPAPLVGQVTTDHVIEKAKTSGMAISSARNMFSSTGAQAFYAERIANESMIAIVQSRPSASTAGFGSAVPLFGTNPIAYGFPTLEDPLIFDMSTSAMTWYGLVLAEAQGADIPTGMAMDANGNETTDPRAALEGALLPFGDNHKGAGLAMAIEVLGGVLAGADYCEAEGEWGTTIMAIDPEVLIGHDEFRRRCSEMVRKIKNARHLDGVDEIRLPGERSARALRESQNSGEVEVDDNVLRELGFV